MDMAERISFMSVVGAGLHLLWPQRSLPSYPQSIIVLKPCCLGDVVLATAAISALRQRYPQAQIDLAVGAWGQAVVINNPHIRTLIDSGTVGQGSYGGADVWKLAQHLRQNRYDLAVTLDRSPLVGLIPWLAGIRHRIGLDSYGRGFAHTVRVPVPKSPRHEALIYLDCVAATGFPPESTETDTDGPDGCPFWTEFYPTPSDTSTLPPLDDTPFVILHPVGGVNPGMQMLDKRWPAENFAALADKLHEANLQVILTGMPTDLPLCQTIADLAAQTPTILAGQLTLGQLGALCRQAALFVGGDTGAMHLAVASGCKTVAIFGPSDPRRYGPFAPSSRARTLWHAFDIPPGGVGQGQVHNFTWATGVTVAEVWAACQSLFPSNSP